MHKVSFLSISVCRFALSFPTFSMLELRSPLFQIFSPAPQVYSKAENAT